MARSPRIMLAPDAHAVYASAGFRPLDDPARWMEIRPGGARTTGAGATS